MGIMSCLGAILIGQFKRCDRANLTLLPKPTRNEIIQPVVSIFCAGLFMRFGLTFNDGYGVYNKWNFSPFCLFFIFLASSTHKFLGIKQKPLEMIGVLCMTAAMFVFVAGYEHRYY